jgi:hypothetical protein
MTWATNGKVSRSNNSNWKGGYFSVCSNLYNKPHAWSMSQYRHSKFPEGSISSKYIEFSKNE